MKDESVQKNTFWIGKFISLIIIVYSLTPRTAAFSSMYGNEIVFIGASPFFHITKEQWGFSANISTNPC